MRMVTVREKVFRNSSGFRFNVSFVDCTSMFVKPVLETSLSFTYIQGVPKVHPLISCAITFDQKFYFYMKFLKYNYYSVEYLCSEVQLPACPLCFLSHPAAVAALSEISHVACRALDDSF